MGRFVSVDPLLLPNDPLQANGYAYAGNNPVTFSDPSGLAAASCPDGACKFGGWAPGTSPASTFDGVFRPPVTWSNPPAQAPDGECRFCGFWCGAGNVLSAVVNSEAFGLVGTVLGVLTPICPVCGMVSLGMAVLSAAVTCAGGIGVACGAAIAGAALGAVGLGAGRLAARAGDRMVVDIGSDAINVSVGGIRLHNVGYDAAVVTTNTIKTRFFVGDVFQAGTQNYIRGIVFGNVWQVGPDNTIRGIVFGKITRLDLPGG